jgi:aspartate/methionine/tyrosine aminotransferase
MKISQRAQSIAPFFAMEFGKRAAASEAAGHHLVKLSMTGFDSWQFCERALQESHVALTPGWVFGRCGADTHVRLSYAVSNVNLEEANKRLGQFIDRLRAEGK